MTGKRGGKGEGGRARREDLKGLVGGRVRFDGFGGILILVLFDVSGEPLSLAVEQRPASSVSLIERSSPRNERLSSK